MNNEKSIKQMNKAELLSMISDLEERLKNIKDINQDHEKIYSKCHDFSNMFECVQNVHNQIIQLKDDIDNNEVKRKISEIEAAYDQIVHYEGNENSIEERIVDCEKVVEEKKKSIDEIHENINTLHEDINNTMDDIKEFEDRILHPENGLDAISYNPSNTMQKLNDFVKNDNDLHSVLKKKDDSNVAK